MRQVSHGNIAAYLPQMAKMQPDTAAIIFPAQNRTVTFAELDRMTDRTVHALSSQGIIYGMRVAVMVPPSPELFALTFALFKINAVPVLIDPGLGIKNLKKCLNEAAPAAFIGIPKAQIARILFGWGKSSVKTVITVGKSFFIGKNLTKLMKQVSDDQYEITTSDPRTVAAILFTSGSTGPPKGAIYTHGNFLAQIKALQQVYNIKPGEIDLPTFPLFALFAPALGMTAVIPQMDFTRPGSVDPSIIVDTINTYKATSMFGSPALINRVGRYGVENSITLPSLKRVISAGAPVPATVLNRFSKMLATDVEIFTPYGATESLPVCSIGSKEILNETAKITDQGCGICIGKPVDSIRLEIIKITDEPINYWYKDLVVEDGVVGEIIVQGRQVTSSYHQQATADSLAKIKDNDDGFFHRMGDLGWRDRQGRIWFCGRKSQRVETEKGPLFTIPVEAVFNTHKEVYRTALVGVGHGVVKKPVLCVELEKSSKASKIRIQEELLKLAASYPHTQGIKSILFHPAFPVDIRHNAKIFREKLAKWAEKKLS